MFLLQQVLAVPAALVCTKQNIDLLFVIPVFDGFRVILFQQTGGLNQSEMEAGLEMNMDFSLAIINAFNMGDMFNGVGYQIRPYEVLPGKTDETMLNNLDIMQRCNAG